MGLDIYAGPLCRYYAGQWQTVVQQWGAANGIPVTVVRPDGGGLRRLWRNLTSIFAANAQEIDPVDGVVDWRNHLGASRLLPSETDWNWPESLHGPFDTDKPDFDGYGAVLLWAAYATRPEMTRPRQWNGDWEADPAFAEVSQSQSDFNHIVGPELWLPVDFDAVFEAEEPNGNQTKIGSVSRLWEQMNRLNDRSWKAPVETVRKWREEGYNPEEFESLARWGFSIWYCLTEFAVKQRVPMRLDY